MVPLSRPSLVSRLALDLQLLVSGFGSCPLCGTKSTSLCFECRTRPILRTEVARTPLFHYAPHEGQVAEAIRSLKYGEATRFATVLGAAFASAIPDGLLARGDAIAAIPLHPARLVERGYNQAALLAASFCARTRVEFAPRLLVRTRETGTQAKLDEHARIANLTAAFRARAMPRGGRVWVLDDVCTTGATLRAAFDALREAGYTVAGGLSLTCSLERATRATLAKSAVQGSPAKVRLSS